MEPLETKSWLLSEKASGNRASLPGFGVSQGRDPASISALRQNTPQGLYRDFVTTAVRVFMDLKR